MPARLFVQYLVEFPTDSNPDTISDIAEQLKDMLYDELEPDVAEIPCIDVTYEKIMVIEKSDVRTHIAHSLSAYLTK